MLEYQKVEETVMPSTLEIHCPCNDGVNFPDRLQRLRIDLSLGDQ
jgi:hypothetical protein